MTISVHMAPGERGREQDLRIALSHDTRFEPLQIDSGIPVDLQFSISYPDDNSPVAYGIDDLTGEEYSEPSEWITKILNMELKRPADFVASVLNGHLYNQTLSIRESSYKGCTIVVGTLDEIYAAIDESNEKRLINGKFKFLSHDDRSNANASTLRRLKSFKKRSFLNGIPVFHKGDDSGFFDGDDVFKDILDLAYDYLLDGDLLGFRMRPDDNEREVAAASMLRKGIGSDSMRILLKEYTLAFVPRGISARPIEDLEGWGPKRCRAISDMVRRST